MADHTLQVQVLVCPLRVGRKVAESMPAAQHPGLEKQIWSARHAQAENHGGFPLPYTIYRDISRLCSVLHGRFSFYSDKKGLYAAWCYPELRW